MILTPLQKLPNNVEDLGKLIVAKGLKKLPKVQKIAQSGYIAYICHFKFPERNLSWNEVFCHLLTFLVKINREEEVGIIFAICSITRRAFSRNRSDLGN